ncbi:MAG: hypothetical protein R3E90_03480 [Marinicella sp.]|nr:hypothetical protein [Xanthomonadales bacterium]
MISEIKNLELIGQSTSLKQHGSLSEMLIALGLNDDSIECLSNKEFYCLMLPDDDDDDADTDADDTESE